MTSCTAKHMKSDSQVWIGFESISTIEAMAMIDQKNTQNLYFVEEHGKLSFWPGGSCVHSKLTEPIRYGSEVIIETGRSYFFRFKKVKAQPGMISNDYINHYWFKKTTSY